MTKAVITWEPLPNIQYVITYKKSSDTIWITPPGNPTQAVPFYIDNMDACQQYDFRIQDDCGLTTFQGVVPCPSVFNLTATPL